ncbi:MAG: hypothetical protein R2795_08705 [Saprospiraceae bacterium]
MATNQHIDTFPLELLFLRMELAGFVLSPADRLRALQLLEAPANLFRRPLPSSGVVGACIDTQ